MAIIIEKLTHTYMPDSPFAATAIENVTATIQDGEFVGIIGHTGSGKSTLIQHLNGLIKPTSGRLEVEGIDVTAPKADLKTLRQRGGLVFQYPEHQLFEETVEKDVSFGPRNLGLGAEEIHARVERALALMGLELGEIGQRSPFELSGGQRQRVAIAGVLAMEPSVLILDEPSAGLDPAARRAMLATFTSIHRSKGCTVLMVSHSMDEVARVASRVLVMNKGHLVMDGDPHAVYARGEELKAMGLGVPAVTDLTDRLRARGIDVPRGMISLAEVRAYLDSRKGEWAQ